VQARLGQPSGGVLPARAHPDHHDVGLFDVHALLLTDPLLPLMAQLEPVAVTRLLPGSGRECQPGDNTRRRSDLTGEDECHDVLAVAARRRGLAGCVPRLPGNIAAAAGLLRGAAARAVTEAGHAGLADLI